MGTGVRERERERRSLADHFKHSPLSLPLKLPLDNYCRVLNRARSELEHTVERRLKSACIIVCVWSGFHRTAT